MKKKIIACLVVALFCFTLFPVQQARAEAVVEWSLKKQLNLEAAALDITTSPDGKWMFILTPGNLLVYSVPEEKVINRIPVDKTFDNVAHSAANNTLIVSSSEENRLKVIGLEFVQHFTYEGLPFKGPRNAPVTLAVFSDYQ